MIVLCSVNDGSWFVGDAAFCESTMFALCPCDGFSKNKSSLDIFLILEWHAAVLLWILAWKLMTWVLVNSVVFGDLGDMGV